MTYFDRIDVSEEINVNKANASKECNICYYWYFLNFSFKFQPNACDRCHDLLMMSMNLGDIAISNIKASDYRCIVLHHTAIPIILYGLSLNWQK